MAFKWEAPETEGLWQGERVWGQQQSRVSWGKENGLQAPPPLSVSSSYSMYLYVHRINERGRRYFDIKAPPPLSLWYTHNMCVVRLKGLWSP